MCRPLTLDVANSKGFAEFSKNIVTISKESVAILITSVIPRNEYCEPVVDSGR